MVTWGRSKAERETNLLAPYRAIRANDLRKDGNVWRSTGADPFIIYTLEPKASSGYLAVELDIEELGGELRPRLYVHTRNGYSQAASEMMRRTGPSHYKLFFYLPGSSKHLRLDPAESECDFHIRKFTIRRTSPATFLARAMRNGANRGEGKPSFKRLKSVLWDITARKGVVFERRGIPGAVSGSEHGYQRWISLYDFHETHRAAFESRVAQLRDKPLISVLMPVYNTPVSQLQDAVESVRNQIYPYWELCIADDASSASWIRPMLEAWQAEDKRIKVIFRPANGHIAEANNSAFELVTGKYVAFLDHDDVLRPHALAEVAFALAQKPDAEVLYSDEDKIDDAGRRFAPFFKPGWNPELFLCQNYFNHLTVHLAENIRKAGGWRSDYNGSQDYDLNLRIAASLDSTKIVHIPRILYHWRASGSSVAVDPSHKNYAAVNMGKALERFARDRGIAGEVEAIAGTPWHRIKRALPQEPPLVSIIIPTRNSHQLLETCINSIRTGTLYSNYEIIVVDNGSDDPASLSYFRKIEKSGGVRVIAYPYPFNYSAINNFAVGVARGPIVLLLNNDIEVISPEWLGEMVALAVLPDTGCVGAKLYYPNDTIQHAGIVLGIGGVAGHGHKYFDRTASGYFGRLKLPQNVSAVTGACLMVRKDVYVQAGGLDEDALKVAFNDVDFCLKVAAAGYRNAWTPYAELYHHESLSRGAEDSPEKKARFAGEVLHMKAKWGDLLRNDPYYSPHLSLRREDFAMKLD